jgi:hypothetical protein
MSYHLAIFYTPFRRLFSSSISSHYRQRVYTNPNHFQSLTHHTSSPVPTAYSRMVMQNLASHLHPCRLHDVSPSTRSTVIMHTHLRNFPANRRRVESPFGPSFLQTPKPKSTMGIPYSRQINAAFEEVTPLVAAGFKVLRTTRNISILLAIIQVLTVFLLFLILLGLVALLYCVNPDLEVRTSGVIGLEYGY